MSPCPLDEPPHDSKPLKSYKVLFAEDVPHYARAHIEAEDDAQAITIARALDTESLNYEDGAWDDAVCKRIVYIDNAEDNTVAADIALDEYVLFNWRVPAFIAKGEYALGVNNDHGDCRDIAILRDGKPVATVIVADSQIHPLIHAGNCFWELLRALEGMLRLFSADEIVTPAQHQSACRNAGEAIRKATGGADA